MSATNHTPTLNLSQFVGGVDKPTWLGDYNSDMEKIDTSIHNLEIGTTSTIARQIRILDASVQELFRLDTNKTVKIDANTSSISNIQMNLTVAQEHIDSLDERETLHNTATTAQLDSQKTILNDMTKNMNHFELNMNRIEDMAVLSTASVARLELRMAAAESDIRGLQNTSNDYGVDIDNLKTEIDTLETTTRLHDADINNAKRALVVLTSSVADNQIALETYKEKTDGLISDIQNTSNNNATEITNIKDELSTTTNTANTVNTRTENIAEGVAVPFGFGIDATGKYGYIPNNETTITPFATETDISGMRDEINETMADVGDLKTKTANITSGKALPYSLGITGNQYGYIPNGETGVVPFISRNDIDSIVNLEPIRANITEIENNISTTNSKVSGIESNMNNTNDNVDRLNSEVIEVKNNMNNTNNNVDMLNSEVIEVKNNLTAINSALTSLQETNTTQDSNINEISSNIDNIRQSISLINRELNSIRRNISQTTNDIVALQGRVDTLNTKTSGMVPRVEIPFSFGVDDRTGYYGYKKTGSNNVIPFFRDKNN